MHIRQTNFNFAVLQFIVISSMVIDHLGVISVLGDWSRYVGRLALPGFVVMVAANALHSSSLVVLLRRFGLLFLLSQPLWVISVGVPGSFCILVTLACIAVSVHCRKSKPWVSVFCLSLFLIVSPYVEYGFLPLLIVPVVVWPSVASLLLALSWPLMQYTYHPGFALMALVGLLLALFVYRYPVTFPRLPRYATRFFYPLHLFLIVLSKPLI